MERPDKNLPDLGGLTAESVLATERPPPAIRMETYNRRHALGRALLSIPDQKRPRFSRPGQSQKCSSGFPSLTEARKPSNSHQSLPRSTTHGLFITTAMYQGFERAGRYYNQVLRCQPGHRRPPASCWPVKTGLATSPACSAPTRQPMNSGSVSWRGSGFGRTEIRISGFSIPRTPASRPSSRMPSYSVFQKRAPQTAYPASGLSRLPGSPSNRPAKKPESPGTRSFPIDPLHQGTKTASDSSSIVPFLPWPKYLLCGACVLDAFSILPMSIPPKPLNALARRTKEYESVTWTPERPLSRYRRSTPGGNSKRSPKTRAAAAGGGRCSLAIHRAGQPSTI